MTKFNGKEYPSETTISELTDDLNKQDGFNDFAQGFKTKTNTEEEQANNKPFAEELISSEGNKNPSHIKNLSHQKTEGEGIKIPSSSSIKKFKCLNCAKEQYAYKDIIMVLCLCGYNMELIK